jgi:glycosyltransferase involved in cell wall biosynthesis
VHVHGTGLFQTALCITLRVKRIPFVWTLHGITEKETYQRYRLERTLASAARYSFYTTLERTALAFAPDIFVDTPYVEKEIRTRNRVHILPIGIFTREFADLRERKRPDPVVLSLGVIDPRKGHHFTLRAFAKIHSIIPEAKLIIAGSLTVPSYFEALKELAKKLNVHGAVEFAIDHPRSEIVAKLGQARLFALHSQEESQGIALCEALAAGLPIIATRVGGIPFVVTEGKDGLLTNYGDVPAFTEAMARLLADEALWEKMSQAAAISSIRFDWNTIAEQVIAVYRQASAHAAA